ncbi:uncharacterized protein LOC128274811 [Anopheles cruzii]|uniref:uncharacterized protein LOC128274811 n=1 Tax=Anopheles cruzii TaxID=68878 RepID=UPI0022EC426E|nr:uncharacterized protein LOC128274811 [Anopheles cruzii]
MSSRKSWKTLEELVSSPLLTEKKASTKKPKLKRQKTTQRMISKNLTGLRVRDLMIENSSDDEFQSDPEKEHGAEKVLLTQSQTPFISPAEVAIEGGNSSDSELVLSKDDEDVTHRRLVSSPSEMDDCSAIHCKKKRVPHVPFPGVTCMYYGQIVDDLNDSCASEMVSSVENPNGSSCTRFKACSYNYRCKKTKVSHISNDVCRCAISELSPSSEDLRSQPPSSANDNGASSSSARRRKGAKRTKMGAFSTTQWNIVDDDSSSEDANCETYDASSTVSNLFIIEDIQPSQVVNSPEMLSCPDGNALASEHANKPSPAERHRQRRNTITTCSAGANLFNIEELLPSPVENSSSTCFSTASSFYENEMPLVGRHTKGKYRTGSPLKMLATVLREKTSIQRVWFHEMLSGIVQPKLLVTLETIERCYGRVLLHFYTTTDKDDCRQRIENIIILDSGDKQLQKLEVGMKIALELDEQNLPLRISRHQLIHLGVFKLFPALLFNK